jgi:hypothetical protein
MRLTDIAQVCLEEGYPISLDLYVGMMNQGVDVAEFTNKIDGFSIDELIDQMELIGD